MKRIALAGLLLLLLATISLTAQEITGNIVGNVKDASGSVIANATVTVTNTDRNQVVRTIKTDQSGDYTALLLPIGHYKVEVDAQGFKKFAQTSIELNVNDRLTFNFVLQVGSSQEVVNVEANALQVETQTAAATGLISGTEVRQLSLNNRNYEQLVSLMPGVTYGGGDQLYIGTTNPAGQANVVSFSINGARNSSNNWTVDGADNVDRGSNLTLLNYPSIDAIAEFKVLRGLYSPEFGRGAGQINVVTKSGTSAFHGDAYEFVRNEAFAANDYFRKRTPLTSPANIYTANHPAPLRYNNFGYTIGGPVYIPGVYNEKKDKTFFFFSQEFRRVITYTTVSGIGLPTSAEKGGVFPYDVCAAFSADRKTCTQVLPAGTPLSSIHPISQTYLKDIWGNTPEPDDPYTHSKTLSFRNVFNARQELARIDHTFSPRLSVFGRYLRDTIPTTEPFGLFGPNSYVPNAATSSTDSPGRSWVFRATATLTNNLLFEGGYGYTYGAIKSHITGTMNAANSPDLYDLTKAVMPYASIARIPSFTISGFSGVAAYGPYDNNSHDNNIFGSLSWLKGKHNFRFGGQWHGYMKTENAAGNNAGTFAVDTTGAAFVYGPYSVANCPAGQTAPNGVLCATMRTRINNEQAWANFLTGNLSSFSQVALDLTPRILMNQFEAFAQDEWRVRPNLTISYGVRYSYFPQPYNDNEQVLSNFDPAAYNPANAVQISPTTGYILLQPGTTTPTVGDPLNGMIFASGSLKNSPYGNAVGEGTHGNFAPRIGIAWDPFGNGKTSIRTGYGIFYQSTLVGTYEQAMFLNPPYARSLSITGNATSGFPTLTSPLAGASNAVAIAQTPPTIRGVQTSSNQPYTQQWSLDLQQDLGSGMLVDIGYYGSKDTHLLGMVDVNQPLPGQYITDLGIAGPLTSGQNVLINAIRPYKGYGPINTIRPWFTGNYNSFQSSFEKRFKGSSTVKVNYTWSHAMTTNWSDRSNAPANTYDIGQNYGPSQLDRRHVVTASYVYELPWFQNQKGLVGHLLGGWQTSGIVSIATGLPLNIASGNVVNGTSVDPAGQGCIGASQCPLRVNQISDPNVGAPNTLQQWFNIAAFAPNNTPGQVGTARSGAIRGPGYWRADMSLFKNLKFTERIGMQLRLETFNTFNHENYNSVNVTQSSLQFGQITGSRDPRLIQLGAKLTF